MVPGVAGRVGDEITVTGVERMLNRESKALRRRFDVVYVGSVAGPRDAATESSATARVARSVGELWAQRASLGGATVAVRARVVKVNPGIGGANWYRLRDGAERAEGGDLAVVTPADAPLVPVGDVVTFQGTLALEKDFGGGYSYPAILIDAKVVK